MKKQYYVELTDLFGGELNYSYIHRYLIKSTSVIGAISKLSRETGLHFRKYYDDVYHSTSKLTGVVIEPYENNVQSYQTECYKTEL